MRIIEKNSFMESILLQEIMDKSVKNIKSRILNSGQAVFTFIIPRNIPNINEYNVDFEFTVSFTKAESEFVYIKRPDIFQKGSVKVKHKTSRLTFSNNITGMQDLGGENGYMHKELDYPKDVVFSAFAVYGTIARILINYLNAVSDRYVQGINFSTAHTSLVKPYIILCKEAERKGELIWADPNVSRNDTHASFDLIRKSVIDNIKNIVKGE